MPRWPTAFISVLSAAEPQGLALRIDLGAVPAASKPLSW